MEQNPAELSLISPPVYHYLRLPLLLPPPLTQLS